MKVSIQQNGFTAIVSDFRCEDATYKEISQLKNIIFQNGVILIRDQNISSAEYVKFMNKIGSTVPHILDQYKLPGHNEILVLSNYYDEFDRSSGVHEGGAYWHTDMSYLCESSIITSLYARKVPLFGGKTFFIDCVAALPLVQSAWVTGKFRSALPDMTLDKLIAVHHFGNRERLSDKTASYQTLTEEQDIRLNCEVTHPLVITHPRNGNRCLYAIAGTSIGICGMNQDVALTLLNEIQKFLLDHAPRYSHCYQVGDMVLWDNLATLHSGELLPKSYSQEDCRLLYRINVKYSNSKI